MKRPILLKALFLILAGFGFIFSSLGQTYVSSSVAGQGRDSVTVGSRAGYRVTPDPAIVALPALFNASTFQWVFSNAAPILQQVSGAPAVQTPPASGFYLDTAISAVMPAAASTISVSVAEKSNPKVGTGCLGNVQTLNIDVFARATISFTGTSDGACGPKAYNIPVNLTGFGPWTIEYSITYTNLLGVSAAPVNYVVGSGAAVLGTWANKGATSLTLPITALQLNQGNGTYAVSIINAYDRFAMKSLDMTLVATQAGEKPAAPYDLYVYPTPNTSPIQHVKNF